MSNRTRSKFGMTVLARVRPLVFSITLLSVVAVFVAARPIDSPLLVTVGEVTDRSAVVWGRGNGPGRLSVEYSVRPDLSDSRKSHTILGRDYSGTLLLTGLTPGTRYYYTLAHEGRTLSGQFVTAPPSGEVRPVSFLWSGDLGGASFCRHPGHGYPIFAPMARLVPDFFLFVGDTIYADSVCRVPDNLPGADFKASTLDEFRARHRYNRADSILQQFFRVTSVYAIWDDHEVKNDFSGSVEPLMPVGRQAFFDYWPLSPPADDPTRLHRRVRWGKLAEIFILDTRQYRSPNSQPDDPSKTMLGAAQKRWLVEGVLASDATWKIVVSSVTLSVPTNDGWAKRMRGREITSPGYEAELTSIVKRFSDQGVKNLVWLSADVHHAAAVRYTPTPGFTMHEFTAGPLSASMGRPRALSPTLHPAPLFGKGDFFNFGQVTIDQRGLTVRFYDSGGQPHYEERFPPEL